MNESSVANTCAVTEREQVLMNSSTVFLVLAAPLSLVGVALLSMLNAGSRPRAVERASGLAAGLGVLVAAAAAAAVASGGALTSPLVGAEGVGFSVRLDALSVTILLMVSLLGVAIMRFSRSYLDGDPRQGAFLGWLAATTSAVEFLVLANNLALLLAAWIATSLSLHQLLVFYRERPRAVIAARKKFIAARLGDVSLGAACVLLYRTFGTGELEVILRQASTQDVSTALTAATALIALTALLKSAQFPTHGWLVEVMETPTPVSALLHAGILNAGPFLVMRFAPVMELGTVSNVLLVLGGGFTALFASVVLRTQPTVKVALGYSSAAHMGFMLLVCGLGVYPAAVLHLVAHSFYKAHAFLSSGSVVDVARAEPVRLPPRLHSPTRILVGLGLALVVYGVVGTVLGFTPWDHPALLAVGAIVVMGLAQLLGAGLDSRVQPASLFRIVGLALVVTLAFFGLEEAARLLLIDVLPPAARPDMLTIVLASIVLVAFAAAVAVQVSAVGARSSVGRALHVHLRNGLYANALFDRLVGALRQ